ncbi:phospholipase D family protein [Fulvimonas sp. R45]|uniref:phospholipase D-like domain-containing protein n=1 Tax=Fulvimonas sp. R45 TaxID=3045937 RepID=UPI00265D6C1E|nr:phospholipase D family protein [Fulvimonas sp. R45]MDO1529609.1 phospholipase D family protein [Fulvimonas sp. R45]
MRLRWCALLVFACAALLQGCTLTRAQIRRADALVAASPGRATLCQRADHCALPSPLLRAADQALAESTAQHPVNIVTLLDDSEAALVARLNLIRAARRSIDVQTYIWDQDDIGQLVLDELVQAARRGVQVRILADQLFSFEDVDLLDRLARVSPNFHVKLYNPTFHAAHTPPLEFAAGVLCCFMKFNQRMHNKLVLVDDSIGITGGRNYQNRYFNWDDGFNYVDRDVMVGGAAAKEMAASFDLFWHHKRSVALTHLRDVNRRIRHDASPPAWPTPHYTDPVRVARAQEEAEDQGWLAQHLTDPSLRTGRVDYFSDLPAKTDEPHERSVRAFTSHLMHLVANAKREVVLQTPYLVISKRARRIFERLHKETPPPRIVISTNSLASTDAFAVYAMSYKHRKRYLTKFGFEIHELKPHADSAAEAYEQANVWDQDGTMPDDDGSGGEGIAATGAAGRGKGRHGGGRPRFPGTVRRPGLFGSNGRRNRPAPLHSSGRRFALHAKSMVVDDRFAMVGSHNFDPRSDHYNTEAGVIVYDPRFADELRDSILRDTEPQNAWVIAARRPTVPVLGGISQVIGDVSAKLPLFDLWPFRYATSYDLKPGCTPLSPFDPKFHDCYTPVGDFPDVALSPKLIVTRLITAFGAGVKGIL